MVQVDRSVIREGRECSKYFILKISPFQRCRSPFVFTGIREAEVSSYGISQDVASPKPSTQS